MQQCNRYPQPHNASHAGMRDIMAKPITDKIAELQARKAKLEADLNAALAQAREEERKRDLRRRIVVGGAVLEAIASDAVLMERVRVAVAGIVSPIDREVVADLLDGTADTKPAAVGKRARAA